MNYYFLHHLYLLIIIYEICCYGQTEILFYYWALLLLLLFILKWTQKVHKKRVVYILTGNYMYVITHIEQREQVERTAQMIVFQSLVPINKLFKKER